MSSHQSKRKRLAFAGAVASLPWVIFSAQTAASSLYFGIGYGAESYHGGRYADFSTRHLGSNFSSDDSGGRFSDHAAGQAFYVGYKISPNFHLELGYSRTEGLKDQYEPDKRLLPDVFDPPNSDRRHHIETVDLERYSATLIGKYPLTENFSVFSLVGYSHIEQKRKLSGGMIGNITGIPRISLTKTYSEDEQGFVAGFGAKYAISDSLKVRLQWTRERPGPIDIKSTRLSLETHF